MKNHLKILFISATFIISGCSSGSSTNSNKSWTWMTGSSESNAFGSYGTKGIESSSNTPGARWGAISWTDESGNFWLFGGDGNASNESGNLNDLWKYNPTSNQWTWVNGNNTSGAYANYGTKGIASPSNTPGANSGGTSWRDNDGNLWMFGGIGHNNSSTGYLNDMWKYNTNTNQWTWEHGRDGHDFIGIYGIKGVADRANTPDGRIGSTSWTDSSGNLWMFGGVNATAHRFNDLWKYNPNTNQWTWVSGESTTDIAGIYGTKGQSESINQPGSRYDAISWVDNNGIFWIFGGFGNSASNVGLLNDLWSYNPSTNQWTWINGSNRNGQSGSYGNIGVSSDSNTPGARNHRTPFAWADKNGNLWMFGGVGYTNNKIGVLNDLWMYNPTSDQWTWEGGSSESNAFGTYNTLGVTSSNSVPGARHDAIGWIDNYNNLWIFGGTGNSENSNGNLNDLWKYNGITATTPFPIIQYISFPGHNESATFITGIRQIVGSSNVIISAISPSTTASLGLIYSGTLDGSDGQWYQFTPPTPLGQNLKSINLYGPNSNSNGTITVVGSYNTFESSTSFGLLYQGNINDGNNPNNWKTLMPASAISTILHSNMGGLAAGNYNINGDPAGKSFIYEIATESYTYIHKPNTTESSITIYGIWWNGQNSYTIAGGYSILNESGLDIGFVADYNSVTHEVSNWTDYYYNNLSGDNIISHFEGITGDGHGGYNLAADVFSFGKIEYGVQPAFVHVSRNTDGSFNPIAKWTDIIYPDAVLTSANTVYQNSLLGVYSFEFNLTGVNSFVATVPNIDY